MTTDQKTPPRSLTSRGTATCSRIVDAAASLIYAQGVNGTSLDDVMAASGVSKSQLYHYFADKDALVLEVIAHQTQKVLRAQQPHLEALDSLAALRAWRDAMVTINEQVHAGGCPLGSLASELATGSEDARLRLVNSFERWADHVERGLLAMRDRGELGPAVDTKQLAMGVLCAVQGGLLMAKTMKSSRPLATALDMAIDHVASFATG